LKTSKKYRAKASAPARVGCWAAAGRVGIGDDDGDGALELVGVTVTVEVRRAGVDPPEQADAATRTTTTGKSIRRIPRMITPPP
jgi:hypothetical protein